MPHGVLFRVRAEVADDAAGAVLFGELADHALHFAHGGIAITFRLTAGHGVDLGAVARRDARRLFDRGAFGEGTQKDRDGLTVDGQSLAHFEWRLAM